MKIINHNKGRLGNSIFRLLANIVFLIVYDIDEGEILYSYRDKNYDIEVTDDFFVNWSNAILNGKIPIINKNSTLYFTGYYQHDKIFLYFRPHIIEYINKHPNLLLLTDRNEKYMANELINYKLEKNHKIVLHIRLEDFIQINQVLNPLYISKILDDIIAETNNNNICIVVNQPKSEIENNYIDFFKKKYDVIVESNDPIKDYNIMKNAEFLICSYSTLSWCAAFFSDTIKSVYIPNYKESLHQTFKTLNNSKLYECIFCDYNKLQYILNENKYINEKSYSLTDYLGKPIDFKLDQLFNNKTDGFYIELGAFDGLTQSNSAFFEFYRNWDGILIEPSLDSFNSCLNNRPKSYTVNACCVSNEYSEDKILGDFNSITMSSVNGARLQSSHDKLVEVTAITLEKILDEYFIKNGERVIDFISIDTEGYELDVLKGLNFNKYQPKYLLIEIYKDDYNNICSFLSNYGYNNCINFTNYNNVTNPIWDGTHNDFLFYKTI